jgi:hypothetical protein
MREIHPAFTIEEITDPDVLAKARAQDERFGRNLAWFEEHGPEIFSKHRGQVICIAGQELFAADTGLEAISLAKAAHPDDDGRFTYRVPREKAIRIYAH